MSSSSANNPSHHIPILLEPIAEFLTEGLQKLPDSAAPGVILDCTLGGGGHTARILEKMRQNPALLKHRVVGIDRDPDAIARDRQRFATELSAGQIEIVHASFSRALEAVGNRPIYGLMADLGISSDQIDSESRGFSFRFPAPLDMRMNTTTGESLQDFLAHVSEAELSEVIWKYGEERFSRKIARRIVDLRSRGQLPKTSTELADVISSVFPPPMRYKGIHPATRTFQALRISVNEELAELELLIRDLFPKVAVGGHLAILSFHSLEDRLVKEEFRGHPERYQLPTKKAIQATDAEVELNSRSRSAKLRLAVKK
jgi:16S rRNA (cytosine1402-N4)-methyltransferase